MEFSSYTFLGFLLIVFLAYYMIPKRFQWVLLLGASYVFYFWSMKALTIVLFAISTLVWLVSIQVEKRAAADKEYLAQHKAEMSRQEQKAYKKEAEKKKRRILLIGLLGALAVLGVFKYTLFVIDNVNEVIWHFNLGEGITPPDMLLPLGISFFTLQALGYLLDVYWGRYPAQHDFPKFLLFVSFFPQLIQGPISRYDQLSQTLYGEHAFDWKNVRFGFERILWGYFKKLVIADAVSQLVLYVTTNGDDEVFTGVWVLVGLLAYSINLYADFTGGIDITIGVAQILGIKVQENFLRPYFSKSIAEYWRRWHLSMGTWFRDYVFYPISLSSWLFKLSKSSKNVLGPKRARRLPVWISTMVTWLATGIWHGAKWYFVVWGLLNGLIILISEEFKPLYAKFHEKFPGAATSRAYAGFQVIRTFFLLGSLRLFDCYQSVPRTFKMFASMFTKFNPAALDLEVFREVGLSPMAYAWIGIGTVLMFTVSMAGRKEDIRETISQMPYIVRYCVFAGLFLAVLFFGRYGVGYDASAFIYNQF